MATSLNISQLVERVPLSVQIVGIALVLALAYSIYNTLQAERPVKGFPLVYLPEEGLSPKDSWLQRANQVVAKGMREHGNRPFQIISGTGPRIVLPNRYADEVKSNPNLSFTEATEKDFFHKYPGFEPFDQSRTPGLDSSKFIVDVVRSKLTQSLGLVTADLVDETTRGMSDIFGTNAQWHKIQPKQNLLNLVSRLSSRVFLGRDLCRDERWLEIARDYTVDAFQASNNLRTIHPLLRPILHWFEPTCKRLRQEITDARKIIAPEIERRKVRARKALEAGLKPPKTADSIGWMYELAGDKSEVVDYALMQMGLSLAAIHTTSEGLSQALIDLIANPHLFAPLREEIATVIGTEGWSKVALYKLRLMDAFLRESQRMHPVSKLSMNRVVKSPVTLSTGEVLPKGAMVVTSSASSDPALYPEPEKFDPYRHLRARELAPNTAQHVSLTASAMGFGYGEHACPGRFFASNEMKIALAYLIIGYDWRVVMKDGEKKVATVGGGDEEKALLKSEADKLRMEFEVQLLVLPSAEVEIRARAPEEREIELGGLMVDDE